MQGAKYDTEKQFYYIKRKQKYLCEFNNLLKATAQVLKDRFPADTLQMMLHEMQVEFVSLIPKIPYIGGSKNELTQNLVICAQALPVCKVLKKHNMSIEQVGEAMKAIIKTMLMRQTLLQKMIMRFFWRLMFGKWFKKRMQQSALQSQKKEYKDAFVYDFVVGDGKTFDFGFDFSDCAICHFFRQEDGSEFVPIMCELDFIMADFVKVQLKRTATLAQGARCCDFRYSHK
ncbi:MAG: L-2-amino-thiazoline-4-carboxylic acid hydrolase [Gammaproteobacteria bacterium]|nr:L-2-amino-thiazoline-4-carboxylic acid hydrolase [Gammaproteobacteria bacterium]